MNCFVVMDGIFINADDRENSQCELSGFKPVQEIITGVKECFSFLSDEDSDEVAELQWLVWNLRQAVTLSLLPFDHAQIGLADRLKKLKDQLKYYPALSDSLTRIIEAAEYLLENPDNPKRKKVFESLKECHDQNIRHALVVLLAKGRASLDGELLYKEIRKISPMCYILSSKKELIYNSFEKIIMPSGGKGSPLSDEVLGGCYGRKVERIFYDSEILIKPISKSLPEATNNFVNKSLNIKDTIVIDEKEGFVTDWENNKYWDLYKKKCGFELANGDANGYVVKARFILLPDDYVIYLPDDRKVQNITNLVAERGGRQVMKKIPRTIVSELCVGDLIVLRTSGGGDYVVEIANRLMSKAGKKDLRKRALEWKQFLGNALMKEGTKKISTLLKDKGHSLNTHSYLWKWTTDEVIAPESDSRFFELIAILYDLGYMPEVEDVLQYAEEKWKEIRELKHYRYSAGKVIRKKLLGALKELLASDKQINGRLTLDLPGVSAGELSIFRIMGLDSETLMLPYRELDVVKKVVI